MLHIGPGDASPKSPLQGGSGPNLINGSVVRLSPFPKRLLDQFSRFYMAHEKTDAVTTLRL